ncbi:MAG: glycosyltransferase family 39 protein [Microcoleaceae cyanobacterium]
MDIADLKNTFMQKQTLSRQNIAVRDWLPITALIGLGLILRFYQLTTESLWTDEMLSVRDAEEFQLEIPYVRPVYYILLKFWMHTGTSDGWLRVPSVLLGAASIFLIYWLGRQLISSSVGLLAAFAMAVSPLFINHSQEVRMYSLIVFLSLAGTLALSYFFEKPRYSFLIIWAICRIGLILSTSNTVLILVPDTILMFWMFRRKLQWLLASGIAMSLVGITFIPPFWALTHGSVAGNFMNQVGSYPKPGLLQVVGMITQLTVYWPLRYLFSQLDRAALTDGDLGDQSLIENLVASGSLPLLLYAGFTVVLFCLLGISLFALTRPELRSKQLCWLTAWAIIPTMGMLWVSYTKGSIWFPRYLLFVTPYYLLLMGAGFMAIWNWKRKLAVAITLAYIIGAFGGLKDYYTVMYRNDWKGVAQYLESNAQPGDTLIYYSFPGLKDESLPRYYEGIPINFVNRDRTKELDEPTIDKYLGPVLPVESRLWFVCWTLCRDRNGIERLFNVAFDEDYQIAGQSSDVAKPTKTFRSLETNAVEVFLVTPSEDGSADRPNTP